MEASLILKTARQRAGLSVRATARLAGTSASTLSAYEAGTSIPSFSTLNRIISATGNRLIVSLHKQSFDETRITEIEQLLRFADQVPRQRPGSLHYPLLADMVKQ